MQIGYIVARAYASDAEIPIQNATFSVVTTDEQNQELIGIRLTDENGKTDPIPIEAPDESLSTSPGNVDPFTRVNVRLDHPEYNSYLVEGVQVFAGQVSLINAPMIPTAPHISFDNKGNSFDTNEQNTL
ncbi:MAG: hypothetical protein IKA95_04595 [Clostridia bacterium]|nr:hypothetical protein [Clostridia bacterium]